MKLIRWICALVIVVGLAPLVATLASTEIASLAHCELDEGSVHACIIGGHDVGNALYMMFVSGWYGIFALPYVAGAVAIWTLTVIVGWLRRRFARPE